jgi:hypothetical protein
VDKQLLTMNPIDSFDKVLEAKENRDKLVKYWDARIEALEKQRYELQYVNDQHQWNHNMIAMYKVANDERDNVQRRLDLEMELYHGRC